jgi:hypothetical protein
MRTEGPPSDVVRNTVGSSSAILAHPRKPLKHPVLNPKVELLLRTSRRYKGNGNRRSGAREFGWDRELRAGCSEQMGGIDS